MIAATANFVDIDRKMTLRDMKPSCSLCALFLLICGCFLTPAWGQGFSISPALLYFHYTEYNDNGAILNRETGPIPGLELTTVYTSSFGRSVLGLHVYSGHVDYDGATQSGSQHSTRTLETLSGVSLTHYLNEAGTEGPLLSWRLHNWDRDILPKGNVSGLEEIYQWSSLGAGYRLQHSNESGINSWAELQVYYVLGPKMTLLLPGTNPDFALGSRPGFQLEAGMTLPTGSDAQLDLSFFMDVWEFEKSETKSVDNFFGSSVTLHEPRSVTRHIGLRLRYAF